MKNLTAGLIILDREGSLLEYVCILERTILIQIIPNKFTPLNFEVTHKMVLQIPISFI
jgi:hypothetical protein